MVNQTNMKEDKFKVKIVLNLSFVRYGFHAGKSILQYYTIIEHICSCNNKF